MSRARGLGKGRERSALLLIKHVIVWSWPMTSAQPWHPASRHTECSVSPPTHPRVQSALARHQHANTTYPTTQLQVLRHSSLRPKQPPRIQAEHNLRKNHRGRRHKWIFAITPAGLQCPLGALLRQGQRSECSTSS